MSHLSVRPGLSTSAEAQILTNLANLGTSGAGFAIAKNSDGTFSNVSISGGSLTIGSTSIASGTNTRVLFDNAGTLGEYAISGTGSVAMTTSPSFITPAIGAATGTSLVLTNSVANGFVVGQNGVTNPTLQVDSSVATSVTGIAIQSQIAGGNIIIVATSSNAAENLQISAKGTGALVLQSGLSATSRINIASTQNTYTNQSHAFTAGAINGAATVRFSVVNAADLSLTAGTEAPYAYFNLANNVRTHASNTAIALQRDFRVSGTTHAFATAGGVITDAAAFAIDGPGSGGTNATLTNAHGLHILGGAITNVTNGYSATFIAPSGAATINAAAQFTGAVYLNDGVDATKRVTFAISTVSTGTVRTVTFPDASGTVTLLGNASTGSGSVVLANTPTLITPNIGAATGSSLVLANSLTVGSTNNVNWSGRGILTSPAAGTIQHGNADAAAPVAQILSVQSVVTGTTDTAGQNFTIKGSAGTGTGAGGSIIFQTAPASTTGSTPNGMVTALTINSAQLATFAGHVALEGVTSTGATGTGAIVFATSPTLTAPTIGAAAATRVIYANNAITAVSNAATVPVTSQLSTVTNNSAATLTITITTSGATDGQLLIVRVYDFSAAAQTLTLVNTENSTITPPASTNGSTTLPVTLGLQFNGATSKWRIIAAA